MKTVNFPQKPKFFPQIFRQILPSFPPKKTRNQKDVIRQKQEKRQENRHFLTFTRLSPPQLSLTLHLLTLLTNVNTI